jgi:hypothetical protein
MNDHYVMINSGLPWWTPPAIPTPQGIELSTHAVEVLADLKDFILFKGNPYQVISEGYFNENWEIPEEEIVDLRSSGVITIK